MYSAINQANAKKLGHCQKYTLAKMTTKGTRILLGVWTQLGQDNGKAFNFILKNSTNDILKERTSALNDVMAARFVK